ncbi:hypothetical protein GGI43DRAFT_384535 [Trichoderma evansii]
MPAEALGTAFFFHHYAIIGPQCSAVDTAFARLSRLAVGMAGAATSRKDVAMMTQARFKYALSLQHLARAVNNPAEMTAASTLAAVNKLSMFEMITCQSYSSMDAYLHHIRGLVALIKRWGRSDWISMKNLSGGLHVMFLATIACLIEKIPIDEHVSVLVADPSAFESEDDDLSPARRLFEIVSKFTRFYSSIMTSKVPVVVQAISDAMGIEEDLSTWQNTLPITWEPLIMSNTEEKVHGKEHIVYNASWHAYIWSFYRICRILLHNVLLRHLDAIASSMPTAHPALILAYEEQRRASQDVLTSTWRALQASVPFMLGSHGSTNGQNAAKLRHSTVFGLVAVLQVLMSSTDIPLGDERWLHETLLFIGENIGVGQALVLKRSMTEIKPNAPSPVFAHRSL